jgi:hypothetical protein
VHIDSCFVWFNLIFTPNADALGNKATGGGVGPHVVDFVRIIEHEYNWHPH